MSDKLILVLNCGSSSLKFAIVNPQTKEFYLTGLAECLALADAQIKWQMHGQKQHVNLPAGAAHAEALDFLVTTILAGQQELLERIVAIGHRVVHGGEKLTSSVIIDEDIIEKITHATQFAPIHNPAGLVGIRAAQKTLPQLATRNVAVFDTAFHQSMPAESFLYAIDYELYEKHGIRRYGFHGTSHFYVSRKGAALLGLEVDKFNAITCHLGNGSSVTAVVDGKSYDTSMGLTPLEGLVMGTRSGDIDPGVIFFLHDELGMQMSEIDMLLNKQSGLLGLTQASSDCRFLGDNYQTDAKAARALQVMVHRLAKYIASYSVHMNGRIDALIFTGGIGENFPLLRELVVERLSLLGFYIDKEKNQMTKFGKVGNICAVNSRPILVIPTNEELVIARETIKFFN